MVSETQRILRAIEALFSDVSVSQRATLDYLRQIQADVNRKIAVLEDALAARTSRVRGV